MNQVIFNSSQQNNHRPKHAQNWPLQNANPQIDIASKTDLKLLWNTDVLWLFDVENLVYSARGLGYEVCFDYIAQKIRDECREAWLNAFFSREQGRKDIDLSFDKWGYRAYPQEIKIAQTRTGSRKTNCNSDHQIMFHSAILVNQSPADIVTICSGDGQLVSDLAGFIKKNHPARVVVTLSLAGSTSRLIDSRTNPLIDHNIELGLDCLSRNH